MTTNPVGHFLKDLVSIAPAVGGGVYAFVDEEKLCRGWVQFIVRSDHLLEIHRLWTLRPGEGNGSTMLRSVCTLADRHGVEIALKALPFGRKPHRMTGEQLAAWYQRHGFAGTRRRMVRKPALPA